jgi:hypothetical protein
MSKNAPAAPEAPVEDGMTLTEFCIRLSKVDRRVELIGGFEADEKRAGHVKDSEAAFAARFQAFVTKPV